MFYTNSYLQILLDTRGPIGPKNALIKRQTNSVVTKLLQSESRKRQSNWKVVCDVILIQDPTQRIQNNIWFRLSQNLLWNCCDGCNSFALDVTSYSFIIINILVKSQSEVSSLPFLTRFIFNMPLKCSSVQIQEILEQLIRRSIILKSQVLWTDLCDFTGLWTSALYSYENYDIAIAMSSSGSDPGLGLNILQGCLEGFNYLNQCHCPGWEYLNV